MNLPAPDALEYRVRPAAAEPIGALVLFHGRGADEHDLYPLLDVLDPARRWVGVTPRGPLLLPPGGAHWYVVRQVGYPDPETFHATYRRVSAWLDGLAIATGIPLDRMVLGGFSQGAVMSYALGLGSGRPRAAAIIALSGFIPSVEGFALDPTPPLPPIAIGHGTRDQVISVDFARQARDLLEQDGADIFYRESPIGHAIDPTFLEELTPWLRRVGDATSGSSGSGHT
jgi:phospholipase/carboxylesterase